jgi:hypothetical protein
MKKPFYYDYYREFETRENHFFASVESATMDVDLLQKIFSRIGKA